MCCGHPRRSGELHPRTLPRRAIARLLKGTGVIGGPVAYSPRLDAKGSTVRGVAAFELLAEELGLHAFCCTKLGSSIVERFLR